MSMLVMLTPETMKPEAREGFTLILPKFLWTILEQRAKTLHYGDLAVTVGMLVTDELMGWFEEAVKGVYETPCPSPN